VTKAIEVMENAILGIDIGTSAAKAILFDLSGKEVASASHAYPLLTPEPGWVEQDPEAVWGALVEVLRDVVSQSSESYHILSIALAAQAGSVIPADQEGNPVYPMITWLDTRSQNIVRQWREDGTASTIRRISGWQPVAGLPLPSIAWLQKYRPQVHSAAYRFLGVPDFLVYRLTGEFASDLSAASELLMVDVGQGNWSEELCTIGGVRPEAQAEIGWAGRRIGEITSEAAEVTTLPAGTLVVAGGNDQPCAGLAMGMTAPGRVMLSTGTAWVLMSVAQEPSVDSVPEWVNLYFHAVPQRWVVGQLVGGFGATVDWWLTQANPIQLDEDARDKASRYERLNEGVLSSPPGARGLLFLSLNGPSQMRDATPSGGFVGLQLGHNWADMSRAVLEGCGFEVHWALDELRSSGIPVDELWLAGGANRNPVWVQILADITGVPTHVASDRDWAALGAAALAGWGAGAFSTLEEGIARLQPPGHVVMPNPELSDLYREGLSAYQQASRSLNRTLHMAGH
jgi:xylulokinase